jgi:hypothetical protein
VIKTIQFASVVLLTSVLLACSGGGGNPGSTTATNGSSSTSSTSSTTALPVNDIVVSVDKTLVNNNAPTAVQLTVQAVSANRNAVVGVSGVVELIDVPGGASLSGGPFVTDDAGQFKAAIATGSNKTNRAVTLKVTVGGVAKETAFTIGGSTLQVTLVPGSPIPGATVTLEVTALDSANGAISGENISLSGFSEVNSLTKITNTQGKAVFTFKAPANAGSYSLSAAGVGATSDKSFQVIPTGAGALPSAIGPIISASLSANPAVIGVNAVGTENRAQLRAIFLTTGNTPVQNVRVRYEIIPGSSGAVLGAGESISSGTSIVLSDNTGATLVDYIAGSRSSPNGGVSVRACYDLSDFAVGTCPNIVTANFTVAAKPLSLTMGDNNLLEKADQNTTYIKRFVLVVADSAGQPVPNAQVSFSVDIYKYGKGVFGADYPSDFILTLPNGATRSVDVVPQDNQVNDISPGRNSWCINEDLNRNGNIDGSEDSNGSGSLEPRLADVTISSDTPGNKTDSNGVLLIKVRYPQNVGTWLAYAVKATALAEGSQGTVVKRYITDVAQTDIVNGSFLTAPYGTNQNCAQSN